MSPRQGRGEAIDSAPMLKGMRVQWVRAHLEGDDHSDALHRGCLSVANVLW